MGESTEDGSVQPGATAPGRDAAVPAVVGEAGRQLRAPWAASIAGLLFAVLFTAALLLLRSTPIVTAVVIGALYLAPFAGIMFLWFVAVVRDQIGEREDRFFATVFFGSGLLFIALVFAAAAVTGALVVGVRYLGQDAPSANLVGALRALSYTLLFAFATRAGGVFLISTATIGLRSRTFPAWVAWTGYLVGAVLLLAVTFWDWFILVLPAWVAVISLFILRRERARSRSL
jgi:hypothetical protein